MAGSCASCSCISRAWQIHVLRFHHERQLYPLLLFYTTVLHRMTLLTILPRNTTQSDLSSPYNGQACQSASPRLQVARHTQGAMSSAQAR